METEPVSGSTGAAKVGQRVKKRHNIIDRGAGTESGPSMSLEAWSDKHVTASSKSHNTMQGGGGGGAIRV
jgi:hypothetical protein